MPADNPRIEDLRRRVDKDPASIAFAQLAEEYRRAGDPQEAVRVCRAGLVQHPNYVSARVTLGRSLMELGKLDEARDEFEQALVAAPDNLVALRSMAELYQLRGETPPELSALAEMIAQLPPTPPVTPPPLPLPQEAEPVVPPPLPEMPPNLDAIPEAAGAPEPLEAPVPAPPEPSIDLDAAIAAFNAAFGANQAEPEAPVPAPAAEPANAADPAVNELERWLSNIVADREERDRNS